MLGAIHYKQFNAYWHIDKYIYTYVYVYSFKQLKGTLLVV